MEKINLCAIANNYHKEQANAAKRRAVEYVENKLIPILEEAAKAGKYSVQVVIPDEQIYSSDVRREVYNRVLCTIKGCERELTIRWDDANSL